MLAFPNVCRHSGTHALVIHETRALTQAPPHTLLDLCRLPAEPGEIKQEGEGVSDRGGVVR